MVDDYRQQKILKVPGQHRNESPEQQNPSSAHTIERPVQEMPSINKLNSQILREQQAPDLGVAGPENFESFGMSMRTNTSGTAGESRPAVADAGAAPP